MHSFSGFLGRTLTAYNVLWVHSVVYPAPHFLFGLLEALGHKVSVLKGGDETFLGTGGLWVEHLHTGLI